MQPKNLWYVAQPNEILVDMDKPVTSLPHVEKRLRGAIEAGCLKIETIELHRSFSEAHLHMMITLKNNMSPITRAVWALMFHSDIYRACSTFARIHSGVPCPDLLITPVPFSRRPNVVCLCEEKHNGPVMDKCPAAIALRGDERTLSFFGKPVTVENPSLTTDLRAYERNITFHETDFV